MSGDIAREALHRVAREMGVATALHPQVIATTIIQQFQRINSESIRFQVALKTANQRLEILGEVLP